MTSELHTLLAQLVAIDSTSSRPNAPMLDVLEPRLKAAGFKTERHRYKDEAGVEKAKSSTRTRLFAGRAGRYVRRTARTKP